MMCLELAQAWAQLVDAQKSCRCCAECQASLIQPGARPLFGRFRVWKKGVLFLFEAPNWHDTFDDDKGYLTYDCATDATGKFARELMMGELGLNPDYFQVTNSVLCLPAQKDGRFPIRSAQRRLCKPLIRDQISVLDPAVVVPVGSAALEATRQIDNHKCKLMCDAVASPIEWFGRYLFPLYHTSMQARNSRPEQREDEQRRHWRKLSTFLKELGVVVPPWSRDAKGMVPRK